MNKDIRKDIDTACQEIASNVRKYESGAYDYEHYVATFEGEQNYIVGLFEEREKEFKDAVVSLKAYLHQLNTNRQMYPNQEQDEQVLIETLQEKVDEELESLF